MEFYQDIYNRAQKDPKFRELLDGDKFYEATKHFNPQSKNLSISILGYTREHVDPFDSFILDHQLLGAEEVVLNLALELSQKHQVTIYMTPPNGSICRSPLANPQFLHHNKFSTTQTIYDLLILWNRYDIEKVKHRAHKIFFFPIDVPIETSEPLLFPQFDGIIYMSEYQYNIFSNSTIDINMNEDKLTVKKYPGFTAIPHILAAPGIDHQLFSPTQHSVNPHALGYFSNYSKGLSILLLCWPDIKAAFPNATLDVAFGKETHNTIRPFIKSFIDEHLIKYKDFGVTEHPRVNQSQLAKIMQNTSILAFPCVSDKEMFCLTAIKCQSTSLIPVITRIGSLETSFHPDAPTSERIRLDDDVPKYKAKLLETMMTITTHDRSKYINFAKNFTYSKMADKIIQLYNTIKIPTNLNQPKTLCLVSAFLDIGREKWDKYKSSVDIYFNNFKIYLPLNHEMVVFMDTNYLQRFQEIIKDHPNVKVVPIDRTFMKNVIFAYKQLENEKKIMNSAEFQKKIENRLEFPECTKPEYNMIQHAKIDFIAYVINRNFSTANYYAWTDFGYFKQQNRVTNKPLDINKFNLNKINFFAINRIVEQDKDIMYTLTKAPQKLGGFFYLGRKDLLLKYQSLYHQVYKEFHELKIVDDDQHVMLQCYFKQTELFHVWEMGAWHLVYRLFNM